jgi:hypothetical protein
MASGIYKITNVVNGKCYIGSSVNVKVRFYAHKSHLKHNKHDNRHLQAAYNKYGVDNFLFEVLEECAADKAVLEDREQHYMDLLNACHEDHGYNLAPRAYICIGVKHTAEAIAKRVAANTGHKWNVGKRREKGRSIPSMKPVEQLTLSGKLVAEHKGSLEAAESVGISPKRIQSCCRRANPTAGFYWRYKGENKALAAGRPGRVFPVMKSSLDGTPIQIWENLKAAVAATGISAKTISYACNGGMKHHKGFVWSYIKPTSNA